MFNSCYSKCSDIRITSSLVPNATIVAQQFLECSEYVEKGRLLDFGYLRNNYVLQKNCMYNLQRKKGCGSFYESLESMHVIIFIRARGI